MGWDDGALEVQMGRGLAAPEVPGWGNMEGDPPWPLAKINHQFKIH